MFKLKRFAQKHKFLALLISLFLIFAMVSGLNLVIHPELRAALRGEFTQKGWINYPQYRYKMIDDMEERIGIWNLSEGEMLSILGPTDEEYINSHGDGFSQYNYKLEKRSLFPLFSHFDVYAITFADDGKVTRINILDLS